MVSLGAGHLKVDLAEIWQVMGILCFLLTIMMAQLTILKKRMVKRFFGLLIKI